MEDLLDNTNTNVTTIETVGLEEATQAAVNTA